MSEFLGRKIAGAAGAGLLSAFIISGCTSSPVESQSSTQTTPSTPSTAPPLAQAGKPFACHMNTSPKTLSEAGITNAAAALSPFFNLPAGQIEASALYGLATCQRSITAAMAETAGEVVEVPNISSNFICVTWTAVYENQSAAQAGSPTNHIGLICVPKVVLGPST